MHLPASSGDVSRGQAFQIRAAGTLRPTFECSTMRRAVPAGNSPRTGMVHDCHGESVSELVSGVKGSHFGLSTPAADDTNSRFDNILPGLGLNRATPLDQESPGSIPGGATPNRKPCRHIAGGALCC